LDTLLMEKIQQKNTSVSKIINLQKDKALI